MTSKLFQFLQSSSGENSSKRLAFLLGHLSISFGFFWASNKFIQNDHPDLVVEIYNSYLIYCSILGAIIVALAYGFVKGKKSIEILENEQAAKQVQEKNKYVDDARKLTDDERAKLVQKLTKKRTE